MDAGAVIKSTAVKSTVGATDGAWDNEGTLNASERSIAWRVDDHLHPLTEVIGHSNAPTLTARNATISGRRPRSSEPAKHVCHLLTEIGNDPGHLLRSMSDAKRGSSSQVGNLKRTIRYGNQRYGAHHFAENAFCGLKALRFAPSRRESLVNDLLLTSPD